ncbi:MAG: MBOAT family protein [Bacteroidia bacterium]
MLFNSIEFLLFLPVVFLLYWFITNNNLKLQNLLLLVASYFFYACWDYRFLFLLIFSTVLDYYTGIKMHEAKSRGYKKFWFWLSISVNLGFLGVFKYYNFFAASFAAMLSHVGFQADFWTLKVILPVGISFYTFHGLSYVIDIYKDRIKPVRNFVDYSVFVSFFPLLVAGPIERATHLLPQIQQKRVFKYEMAVDGLRQMLWGLFKKIVIADGCAILANEIFINYPDFKGATLLTGAVFFAIQIYCDFSGYSDIALGTAKLLGINLLRNFAFPYFSRDIAEFWRRWHISLTTWFRDYLYIPLGGSKGGTWMKIRNTFIIFIVSGFWHGANWTFIAWGLLNAIYFLPLLIANKNRENIHTVAEGRLLPSLKEAFQISLTFFLTVLAWIFFRSETLCDAFSYLQILFATISTKAALVETFNFLYWKEAWYLLSLICFFFLVEWINRNRQHGLEMDPTKSKRIVRWLVYFLIVFLIYIFESPQQEFIYFQF